MQDPIDLYYWPTPSGWKISIALFEFDLPFETHLINIGKGDQFARDFLKIAPNNRCLPSPIQRVQTANPFPSLNQVPSCNTSPAKQENSAAVTNAIASPWING